jgi:predicted Zn-dependent peptidase
MINVISRIFYKIKQAPKLQFFIILLISLMAQAFFAQAQGVNPSETQKVIKSEKKKNKAKDVRQGRTNLRSSHKALPKGIKLLEEGLTMPLEKAPRLYKYEFDNGLKVLILPDNRTTMGKVHFILDGGSNREEKGVTGIAHFLEHDMFRKISGYEEGYYDRFISGIGGNANAGTSTSFVMYYVTFPAPALKDVIALEAKRFQHIEFKEPYFSIEKGAVLSERKMSLENSPREQAFVALNEAIEANTTYAWPTIGEKNDIERMTIEDVQKFFSTYYVPNNITLFVGGAIDNVDDLIKYIYKEFKDWKPNKVPPKPPLPSDYFTRSIGKEYICSTEVNYKEYEVVYPKPKDAYEDQVYFEIFKIALDNHEEGTFARRLMKSNLANSFYVGKPFWLGDSSPIKVFFELANDQKLDVVLSAWEKEVARILKTPLTKDIKEEYYKTTDLNNSRVVEKFSNLATEAVYKDYFFGNPFVDKDDKHIVQKMTTEDFHAWILKNLKSHHYYVSGVVPPSDGVIPCNEFLKKAK